jgi:hypothetical protein
MDPQAKNCQKTPEAKRVKQIFPLGASKKGITLKTSWFWTSESPHCERINFYCFKPLCLQSAIFIAFLKNYTNPLEVCEMRQLNWSHQQF